MLLQPMIWMAAGLSRERVVICGDFRQLPPIMNSDRQAIFDLLGRDVFEASGASALDRADARVVMLDTQYRMDDQICALISQRMYGGRLRTATDSAWLQKRQMRLRPPAPFDHALTLIDTSDLRPGEAFEGTSRFNPVQPGSTDTQSCTPSYPDGVCNGEDGPGSLHALRRTGPPHQQGVERGGYGTC